MRLDVYLVENGFCESRTRAREAIKAGLVRIDGAAAAKVSLKVPENARIEIDGEVHPYVSRGGVKLEAALQTMEIDPAGKICLDLGASTGGFCDVLMRAGAQKIYAVDVGTGQLHEKIAADARIVNLEQTHAKDLTRALIPDPIDVIVCDVSFISLKKALPPALALAAPDASLVALIKPQFEVGPEGLGKGGIVKEALAQSAAQDVAHWVETQGWRRLGLMESPIKGGDGNREFLIGAIKSRMR